MRMALLGKGLPSNRRRQGVFVFARNIFKKASEQSEVRDNLRNLERAEIIVRHEFEMRVDFLREIGRKILGH